MKLDKRFFKKFFLISGCLLLAIFAIFAIAYTILNIKWGGELRSELDKLKASGQPMTIKDIAPAPLASAENASVEYQQIFSLMSDGTFSIKNSGNDSKDFKELDPLCFSAKTMDKFEELCKNNSVKINAILHKDSFRQIFELCDKAASKPGMNFNLNYDEGPTLLLPHLSKMRNIARLIRLKAEMEMLDGQREKGWETILTGINLSSQMKTEPLLISQLVYIACDNIFFDFMEYNLPKYGISGGQPEKLMAELAPGKTAYAQSMKKAIDAERICLGSWVFERIFTGKLSLTEFNMLSGKPNPSSAKSYITSKLMFLYRPLAKKDYMEYLKIIERFKAEYNQPYYKIISASNRNDAEMFNSLPIYCILTKMICPSLQSVRKKAAEIETRSQEMRVRLALEEYKNFKKSYPEKLEQLSPQFLPGIPISEMTGGPFEYSKDKGGYKISGGVPAKK